MNVINEISEFLNDVKNYNIFSYEDYKKSSMNLKLLKIKLLNEYYNIKFANFDLKKFPIFIDFDGVLLDTMGLSRKLLLELYGIDYYKHSRDNIIDDKIVGSFFSTIDWNYLLQNSDELSFGGKFLSFLRYSAVYKPTIYSAVSSDVEKKLRVIIF